MLLKRITPRPELQSLIASFWVFEADLGMPTDDNRVIAPNGKTRFIYSYRNGLSTIDRGFQADYKEQDISFKLFLASDLAYYCSKR